MRLFKAGAKRWLLPVRNKPWNIRLPQFLRAVCVSEHTQPSRIAHFILCRKFAYAAIKIPHADFSRRIARDNPMCYNTCESGLECVSKRKIRKFEWILRQFKEETRRLSSAKSRVDDAEMAQKPPKLRIREFLRHTLKSA